MPCLPWSLSRAGFRAWLPVGVLYALWLRRVPCQALTCIMSLPKVSQALPDRPES